MMFDMMGYYKMLKENKINIIYSGPIWANGIEGIAGSLKKRLEYDDIPLSASQSVFSVFVEQMNNMLMYSADKELLEATDDRHPEASKGIFILGSKDKAYFIQTGNIIRNDSVELIRNRIDHLNTLDKAGLREFYKKQIKLEDTNPESKGAGLGFIEIARRASSKIQYSFESFAAGYAFFVMHVTIGG